MASKSTPKPGKGLFGFTQSQMRAQIANLNAKPTGAVSRVSADQAAAIATFGSSLTASVKKQFLGARAGAQEQAVIATAGRKQLAKGAQTIEDIGLIFNQGAKQQAAAAAAAAAQQLAEQGAASNEQLAAFQQQVYMAELQHQWALEDQKRAEAAARKAAGGGASAFRADAEGMMAQAPMVSAAAADAYRTTVDASGDEDWSIPEAMSAFTASTGYTAETPQYALAMAQMQAKKWGGVATFAETLAPAMHTMYDGKPGASKWLEPTISAASSAVTTALASAKKNYLLQNPDSAWASGSTGGSQPVAPGLLPGVSALAQSSGPKAESFYAQPNPYPKGSTLWQNFEQDKKAMGL